MSVLSRVAFFQQRRDEVPNQKLAKELATSKDKKGIGEIAENLWSDNRNVQSDCLKVLYEIGYLNPELIADYAADFLKLLQSKNNRLVWGAMIALSTVAQIKARELYPFVAEIKTAMEKGSVITKDNGVKTLALVASANAKYQRGIFPYLLEHLTTCRPKDVPQHAEKILVAVNDGNKKGFVQVLEKRLGDLTASQTGRIKRVIKKAQAS